MIGHSLSAVRIGIETPNEAHVFMHRDCHVCRAEGFTSRTSVIVTYGARSVIATLFPVTSEIIKPMEAGLSEWAWQELGLVPGARVTVTHALPLDSLSAIRGKVYGNRLDSISLERVIRDVAAGRYAGIHLSAFLTACAARPLDFDEMRELTRAMIDVGRRLHWPVPKVMDKHCVGGLPGNRTTPIVVAIAAACGLTIPKTTSRAITSPAGTADTMETLAPVDLSIDAMRRVVDGEGGCVVWGGAVQLSPADDILIRAERVLDLDGEGQMVASILSKKLAAGATHLVIDLPVGPTAKVRSFEAAQRLAQSVVDVGRAFGLVVKPILSDGTQPVGSGIGPALEARDVLAVLQGGPLAPADLRDHALAIAAGLLELGGAARDGEGRQIAAECLRNGQAWAKFQKICAAQGGLREPPTAKYTRTAEMRAAGAIDRIDCRRLSRIAKLAGAPDAKAAGLQLHVRLGMPVSRGQPAFTVHAESPGELDYALAYIEANPDIIGILHP
ncbi:MAG: thymidine phosphorylase family protein [Alphaproteobacteria bacterium]|nr:thymidine phosphorylase family protein [Alphaproteobacteria bacterium]MBL6936983.1 thymidine phosphorylase family protein [Alphaproteobacteria bacterium]MBL7097752.1 thymidine phosphorylase family protein [Alphaproteobacteria bacterium]